jgi:hypothetical protein
LEIVNKRILMIAVLLMMAALFAGCEHPESELASDTTSDASATAAMTAAVDGTATPAATATPPAAPSTSTASVSAKPLELVESGYTVVSVNDHPYAEVGIVVRNPNKNLVVQFPVVRATMLDAGGHVIGTSDLTYERFVLAGETVPMAAQIDGKGVKPAKITFAVVDPGLKWKPANVVDPTTLTPLRVTGVKDTGTSKEMTFAGTMTNVASAGLDDILVSVILRDASGHIVAGYTGTGEVDVDATVPFTVKSAGEVPKYSKVEIYAQGWSE